MGNFIVAGLKNETGQQKRERHTLNNQAGPSHSHKAADTQAIAFMAHWEPDVNSTAVFPKTANIPVLPWRHLTWRLRQGG